MGRGQLKVSVGVTQSQSLPFIKCILHLAMGHHRIGALYAAASAVHSGDDSYQANCIDPGEVQTWSWSILAHELPKTVGHMHVWDA